MLAIGLLRTIPFVRFAFALGFGIFVASFPDQISVHYLLIPLLINVLFLFLIVFVPGIYQKHRNRWICGVLFILFLFQSGMILATFNIPTRIGGVYPVEATGRVIETDITHSGYYRFEIVPLEVASNDSLVIGSRDRWQIIVEPDDSMLILPASAGNVVGFKTMLHGHSSPVNPLAFDYGKYLHRQGISGTGFVKNDDFKVLKKGDLSGLQGKLNETRNKTRRIYIDNGIQGEELQVLSAITLGMRQELTDEVKNRFVHSGAIHVLAVSGLHVGIIFLFLNVILDSFLPKRSFLRMIIVVFALAFYALLTGAAPSVFRATVMLTVIQVGDYYNRRGNIYNLLGISAFIILLVQPMSLFHAGFWLSHLAVAGIVTFYPLFWRGFARGNIFVRGIGSLTSVSLSAQIGTFPLSLFLFRAFPSWFLLTNFLILPLVAPILILSNLLVGFSGIPFMAALISGLLMDFLEFMNGMVKWLDSLPFAYIQGLWMSNITMVLLYVFIGTSMMWYHIKNQSFFKIALLSCLGVIIVLNFEYIDRRMTNAFVVFDTGRNNSLGLIRAGNGILYADSASSERQLNFACSGFFSRYACNVDYKDIWDTDMRDSQVKVFTTPEGCYIGIGDANVDLLKYRSDSGSRVLGLLCMGNVKGDVAGLMKRLDCPLLIISNACPPWCRKSLKKDVLKHNVLVHNISEDGAFVRFY